MPSIILKKRGIAILIPPDIHPGVSPGRLFAFSLIYCSATSPDSDRGDTTIKVPLMIR